MDPPPLELNSQAKNSEAQASPGWQPGESEAKLFLNYPLSFRYLWVSAVIFGNSTGFWEHNFDIVQTIHKMNFRLCIYILCK